MYCDYFGFKQEPFTIAPDPAFLYPSAKHRQALAHLKYGLDREGGFILLTGEVGTGKTTLTRLLLEQIPAAFRVAYILNAKLDTEDVLASICDELHIELPASSNRSPKFYIDAINKNLLEAHAQGFKTLVVLEEAQNLSEEVLEMLRLLTNLETNTSKLLHILLVGQPELLELIGQPQLRQLNQRVISRFHIQPLNRSESESYLNHRLRKAGCNRALFDRAAINTMHRLSGGIPRKLNLLGERALLAAYSLDREKVSKAMVLGAEKEVFGERSSKSSRSKPALIFAVVVIVAALAIFMGRTELERYWQTDLFPDAISLEEQGMGSGIESDAVTPTPVSETNAIELISSSDEESINAALDSILDTSMDRLDSLPPPEVPETNDPFNKLLSFWQVEADVLDIESFCIEAASNNLRCEQIENPGVQDFLVINRPVLLELRDLEANPAASQVYLLESYENSKFLLSTSSQDFWLDESELEVRISGSAHYLWKPPLGFKELLVLGDSNWAVLNWLQPRLASIDPELEQLITGGRYSQPIRDGVAEFQRRQGLDADGVLGWRTLMKFNEVDKTVPLLVKDVL
jgi:general secretion pathway protein A